MQLNSGQTTPYYGIFFIVKSQLFNLMRRFLGGGKRFGRACRGVTFLELCITIGIAGVLFSLALFLAQHVNAITKIRRAQAELAHWHTAIDDWFVQFGEYPSFDMRISPDRAASRICDMAGASGAIRNLENIATNACVVIDDLAQPVFFSQYISGAPNTRDPWGTPYLYIPADDDPYDPPPPNPRITYLLLSCGPDGKSPLKGDNEKTERDDVYFGQ